MLYRNPLNGQPMDLDQQQRETYAAMPEEAREKLRRFMDTYKDAAARSPDLYNNFIHSVFTKVILEEQMRMEDMTEKEEAVMDYLICSLDDDGLLRKDTLTISDEHVPIYP